MKKELYQHLESGKQIKIAMVALGISSKELARKLNYKESTLCDVIKGRNRNERRIKEIWEILAATDREEGGNC